MSNTSTRRDELVERGRETFGIDYELSEASKEDVAFAQEQHEAVRARIQHFDAESRDTKRLDWLNEKMSNANTHEAYLGGFWIKLAEKVLATGNARDAIDDLMGDEE